MAFPKMADIANLSDEEVNEQILSLKRELFTLRLQKATRRLEKTHLFKHKRHQLAQLLTLEGARKRANAESTAE
ncbi:50S ribosomal protein L29 [Laspinema olomoucense]|uniref:50S ribosomal protein L29 n=1 Tax=Laspinema olomoucense TaxID=3231600 RepID=UPI0021BB9F91|nr:MULTISPECIES: 50S ribosomal protein L29 [unclassified Laspinema]MCT7972212.1 50S ribosomal protein L29 [Laspinema sp. D3d]MCT7990507.1 50S ribosomal protein L29 [Laspinema sp. D3a]MCT7993073.1 50S ribosomal protein L29 [Laspinema sp. D3c]